MENQKNSSDTIAYPYRDKIVPADSDEATNNGEYGKFPARVREHNISRIFRNAGITRAGICKTVSGKHNTEFIIIVS